MPSVVGAVKGSYLAEKFAKVVFGPVGIQEEFATDFFWASTHFKIL